LSLPPRLISDMRFVSVLLPAECVLTIGGAACAPWGG
jgi:hypothetical protein